MTTARVMRRRSSSRIACSIGIASSSARRLTLGARGAAGERRQVLQRDQRPTGEDDGAFDQILQLADVAGIVVQEQGSHGLVSEA